MTAESYHLVSYGVLETHHHRHRYYHHGDAYGDAQHGDAYGRFADLLRVVALLIQMSRYVEWKVQEFRGLGFYRFARICLECLSQHH